MVSTEHFAVVFTESRIGAGGTSRLNTLISEAGYVIGWTEDTFEAVVER